MASRIAHGVHGVFCVLLMRFHALTDTSIAGSCLDYHMDLLSTKIKARSPRVKNKTSGNKIGTMKYPCMCHFLVPFNVSLILLPKLQNRPSEWSLFHKKILFRAR